MSTRNQREQLIHSATGQITIIIGVLICSWLYTIDRYAILSAKISETNISIEKFNTTSKDGISYNKLITLLEQDKGKEELLRVIKEAPKDTQDVIQKVGGAPYLTWLEENIISSSDDKEKLTLKKARLNSILPTLNPISNNLSEETIDMRKYISFIETNILKEFGFDSSASLGIQGITYGKKGTEMPEEVGSFNTELTFKSTNANISKMIDYINTLGHPEILVDTGSSSLGGIPKVMSNPLAMIETLSLDSTLDENKPNDENGGRVVIKFYLRGSSLSDITFLNETIKARKETLGKNISATSKKCSSEDTCAPKKELQVLLRKYDEFDRAMKTIKTIQGIEGIYSLSNQLDSIVSLENELKKITGK